MNRQVKIIVRDPTFCIMDPKRWKFLFRKRRVPCCQDTRTIEPQQEYHVKPPCYSEANFPKFKAKDVDRLLYRYDPLKQFQVMKLISSDTFLSLRSHKDSQALHASIEISKEFEPYQPRWSQESLNTKVVSYLAEGRDSDNTPIMFDTGASFSLTPYRTDFVSSLVDAGCEEITGVGDHKTSIEGVGKVSWKIQDVHGKVENRNKCLLCA